jgi:hypothetical protein
MAVMGIYVEEKISGKLEKDIENVWTLHTSILVLSLLSPPQICSGVYAVLAVLHLSLMS